MDALKKKNFELPGRDDSNFDDLGMTRNLHLNI
jgi:hypothetical protein